MKNTIKLNLTLTLTKYDAEILMSWFRKLPDQIIDMLDKEIDFESLSVRLINILKRIPAYRYGDVLKMSEADFLKNHGFGRKALIELKAHLLTLGLRLRQS